MAIPDAPKDMTLDNAGGLAPLLPPAQDLC